LQPQIVLSFEAKFSNVFIQLRVANVATSSQYSKVVRSRAVIKPRSVLSCAVITPIK